MLQVDGTELERWASVDVVERERIVELESESQSVERYGRIDAASRQEIGEPVSGLQARAAELERWAHVEAVKRHKVGELESEEIEAERKVIGRAESELQVDTAQLETRRLHRMGEGVNYLCAFQVHRRHRVEDLWNGRT